jgi:hypothetical protein
VPARGYSGGIHQGLPVPVPSGQFARLPFPPHSPQGGVFAELVSGLTGEPGLRLAETTSKPGRTFTGSLDGVQTFMRPASPNSPDTLEVSPVAAGVARRTLSRTRGRPR